MFSIFLSNKKCRLEHVVNKLMSCLINEFLWTLIQTAGKLNIKLHMKLEIQWNLTNNKPLFKELRWFLRVDYALIKC